MTKYMPLKYLLEKEMTRKEFLGVSAFAVASIFGIGGIIHELRSHAAAPFITTEPETGTVTSGATVVTDTMASGSKAIKFAALTPTPPPSSGGLSAPLIVPAVNGSGALLRTVGSANRLKLAGVCVWGITDFITSNGNTAANCHTNRTALCTNLASWGCNVIRLRVLADEYQNLHYMGSQANYLQWVKDWVAAATANGMYTMICAWDSLDSQSGWNDAAWAGDYSQAFSMFTAIHSALKLADGSDDPYVFYEPFNEPNGVSIAQWQTAMQGTVATFRSAGYQGLLVIDSTQWSHLYDDSSFTALEIYDAARTSSKNHNLAFARHDYTDDYGGNWSQSTWVNDTGGTATAHVMMETEFGNQNGTNISASFSAAETAGQKTQMFARNNIAGGTAFLANWVDQNSIADSSGNNVTTWGNDVKNWLSGAAAR
jgi:hypothetical protein